MKRKKCEECGTEFEYEPNPNFPDKRKYCFSCSDKKKASYEAMKGEKSSENGSKEEFHLTPEQVRTNALEAAQRWYPQIQNDPKDVEQFWNAVHAFERYINGNSN